MVCRALCQVRHSQKPVGGKLADMDFRQILEEVKVAHKNPSSQSHKYYLNNMHVLAKASYPPAMDFFISCLDDPRWDWRLDALTALGFHYQFPPDSELAEKIRQMLLTDPNVSIRVSAAIVLGGRSKGPDVALIHALQSDPDEDVRRSAFDALLELGGVSFPLRRELMERVKKGEVRATLDEAKRILTEKGIDIKFRSAGQP